MKTTNKCFLCFFGLLMIAALAMADYLIQEDIRISSFYLVPVAAVAAFVSLRAGIFMSVASAVAWLAIDIATGINYAVKPHHLCNVIVRLVFFFIITYGTSALVTTSRRRRQLTAFVIHDLKSPLTNVMAALQNIRDMGSDLSGATQRMINNALASSGRMSTLINSLLDLSRLETGSFTPKIEDVNIRELIDVSTEQISVWASSNKVSIVHYIGTKIASVKTDYWLTMRILINLLSNSIKASPEGSKVEINVSDPHDKAIRFSVHDDGPGMNVPAKQIGGGLGLEFCQLAVKALKGKIWFDSEKGKGTTVSFDLPTG